MLVPFFVQFRDRIGWSETDRRHLYTMVKQSAARHGDAWTLLVDDVPAFERLVTDDPFIATWERL